MLGIQPVGSAVDVPLVQGSYLLIGGEALTPEVVMDAAALTDVRTPAVVVATSAGNLWSSIGSCDLMRPCWLWGRTPWTRGSCTRMCCATRR